MLVVLRTILWCWADVLVVVTTADETKALAVRVRAACNESIRDSVERPNCAIRFLSSDVILVQDVLVHLAI